MIIENQVMGILSEEFPEINEELEKFLNSKNVYKTMQCFANFTKQLIKEGKLNAVKHCFKVAERMLDEGNNTVKNAIQNVYVYSLGPAIYLAISATNQLNEMFKGPLKSEYIRQVCASNF